MSKGNQVNAQLAQLAKLLGSTASPQQGKTMDVDGGRSSAQISGTDPGLERASLVQQLKSIEAALTHLPDIDAFMAARAPLIEQASDIKRKIINTKPLGSRLEGCRSALDRARKRQETANDAVAVALKAQDAANSEATRLESELAELEAAVLSDQQQEAKSTCLERLKVELTQVVSEMQQSGNVAESDMQGAMGQMEVLFTGLVAVAQKAQAVASTPKGPTVLDMLQKAVNLNQGAPRTMPLAPDASIGTAAGAEVFHDARAASGGA